MAIGNKGFYATVQAPKANIGDIAENAVDKKLARDAAEKKAKAEKEAKKEKLTANWKDVKQSNRSLVSETLNKTIFDVKNKAVIANQMFNSTQDPEERNKYKQEFLGYVDQVANLASTMEARAIVEKEVQTNPERFNRFALENYNSVYDADSKGNVELYVSKEGSIMAKTWSVDEATGKATVISDVPFQENLKRPKIMAFDWDSNLKEFLGTVDLDKITEQDYYTSSVYKEEVDKRVKKQVKSKVNNLAENIDAVSDWWIKNNGNNVEAFRELKSMGFEVGEEAVEEFKKEKEEEILQSIAKTIKESKSRYIDTDGDGGKKTVENGDGIISNAKQGRVLTGVNAEGGKTTHFLGDKTMVSSVTTDKNKPIDLKLGGKDYSIEEIVFDPGFADGIVLVDATSYSLSDADRQSQGDKTDTSSSSTSSSEGLRVSNKKLKKRLVLPGEPGFELAVTAINGYYGKDYYKNNKAKMYEKTIAQDEAGYAELKKMRESGNYTQAQLKEKSRELLLKVRGMSKKPAKDAYFKNKNEKARKKAEKESIQENYHSNSKLISAIFRGTKANSYSSKVDVKNKLSEIVTKKDLKKFLKENLNPEDYKGYFPSAKTSSTTQQTTGGGFDPNSYKNKK